MRTIYVYMSRLGLSLATLYVTSAVAFAPTLGKPAPAASRAVVVQSSEQRPGQEPGEAPAGALSSEQQPFSPRSAVGAALWTGAADAAALLTFAAIGRGNHNSADGSVLTTAAPFLLAWFAVSPAVGAFPANARTVRDAVLPLLPAWALAVPAGCFCRGLLQDRLPASPFWIVALIATAVLLSAGRLALLQISEGERAIDRFVAAIVDEDGGDDDF